MPSGSDVRTSSRSGHVRGRTSVAAIVRTPTARASPMAATAAPPATEISSAAGSATDPLYAELSTSPARSRSTGSATPRAST